MLFVLHLLFLFVLHLCLFVLFICFSGYLVVFLLLCFYVTFVFAFIYEAKCNEMEPAWRVSCMLLIAREPVYLMFRKIWRLKLP